jgi:predicted O-methyltransferase YrrM
MRSFRHWTPRYIVNRLREMVYHRQFPDYPWLTKQAVEILATWLEPSDVCLEFGSGRSTLWFAARVGQLTSAEHNPAWHGKISAQLTERKVSNVTYLLFDEPDVELAPEPSQYLGVIDSCSDNSVDFALVDGLYRAQCAMRLVAKIRPGGLLVIDNVNRYLPSHSISPLSRTVVQGPATASWVDYLRVVNDWRCIWTSNGVTDTAIYIKPCRLGS